MKNIIESADHGCYVFTSGWAFIKNLQRETYDILVVDWNITDISAVELIRWVRDSIGWNIPLIFISKESRQEDIVTALTEGADDYVFLHVQPAEIVARLGAVARRITNQPNTENIIDLEPYQINLQTRQMTCNGEPISLTQKEFDLAVFLFRNVEKVVSRSHLLEAVWGHSADLSTRTVDIHVSRLRKKMGLSEGSGWSLTAVYQHGYRLSRTA